MVNIVRRYDVVFWVTASFISGAAAGGLGLPILPAALASAAAAFCLRGCFGVSFVASGVVALCFLAGNIYFTVDDFFYHRARQTLIGATSFEGRIVEEPQRNTKSQRLKINIDGPGRIFVYTSPHPEFSYGDLVTITGRIVPPPPNSLGDYLSKEHIHGSIFDPVIEVRGRNPNPLLAVLFDFRQEIKAAIGRLFTDRQAALLAGVLIGDREGFSEEFLNEVSLSGTMHLIALSGFNIAILVFVLARLFFFIFAGRRRLVFAATFLVVILFVAMVGFPVSALRAALMAFLAALAVESGRLYQPKNAVVLAAFVLTLFNPKAPVFDLGFQLSFAATLGIIYLPPAIKRLSFFRQSSFLGWREVLLVTVSAQLAVAPLTISHFSNFSFTSLPANILVLAAMPLLMVLGFITVFLALVWPSLGAFFSLPTAFLLDYATGVISFFARAPILFNPSFSIFGGVIYYAILAWIVYRFSKQK